MVELVGPFPEYCKVVLSGYEVPSLKAYVKGDHIELVLDDRFGVQCSREEIVIMVPMIANAMAIGGGYSCHGENSEEVNPYRRRVMGLDDLPEEWEHR